MADVDEIKEEKKQEDIQTEWIDEMIKMKPVGIDKPSIQEPPGEEQLRGEGFAQILHSSPCIIATAT